MNASNHEIPFLTLFFGVCSQLQAQPGYENTDDNPAQAAHYKVLLTKNKKLEDQISALEDSLFDVEEEVMALQKKLIMVCLVHFC